MNIEILTLFPDEVLSWLHTSILGRASEKGFLSIHATNIRDFSTNKFNRVDDYPYGGGAGMVMEAEPVYQAWKQTAKEYSSRPRCVYLTPQGKVLNQAMAEELALEENLILLCGHYEGIDERVLEEIVTDYISIGDYVLTGGELGAMVLIDAVSRFVPGVLGNDESSQFESLQDNLLEYPHYTRPENWHDRKVPGVLLSGDHKKIEAWRYEQSVIRTRERRPDLMANAVHVIATDGEDGPAYSFARRLSRYPDMLDLSRKKIRRTRYQFGSRDLILLSMPGGIPYREALGNFRGDHTPVIWIGQGCDTEAEALLLQKGFVLKQVIADERVDGEKAEEYEKEMIRKAARIREAIYKGL